MRRDKLNRYHETLVKMYERHAGEVNHVVESIHEDVNINENISAAPVHLADVATEAVDAAVQVLQTERGILDEISAALARIDDGTFGACTECGTTISQQRLKAIPYTPLCVRCARLQAEAG
jgi:RNA polymerase-binding transcription factor DksA